MVFPLCRGLFFVIYAASLCRWVVFQFFIFVSGVCRFFFVRMVFPIAFPLCRFSLFDYLSSLSLFCFLCAGCLSNCFSSLSRSLLRRLFGLFVDVSSPSLFFSLSCNSLLQALRHNRMSSTRARSGPGHQNWRPRDNRRLHKFEEKEEEEEEG